MILLHNKNDADIKSSEDESGANSQSANGKNAEKRTKKTPTAAMKAVEPRKKKAKKSKQESSHIEELNTKVKEKAKKREAEVKDKDTAEPVKKKSKKSKHETPENEGTNEKAVEEGEKKELCCILISNVDGEIKEKKIIKYFTAAGVEFDGGLRRNVKKRTCYVDLRDHSALTTAVNLSGTKIKGHTITVEHVPPKPSLQSAASKTKMKKEKKEHQQSEEERSRVLFVGNVGFDVTAEELKKHFAGAIDVRLPVKHDDTPLGFAFVEFAAPEQAKSILSTSSLWELKGRQLRLDLDSNRSQKVEKKKKSRFEYEKDNARTGVAGKTKTLYVKNIAPSTTEETLRSEFPDCSQARLATNSKDGKPRGFAFLDFETADTAQAAFEKKKGAVIDGRKIKLDFASELKNPPAKFGGGTGGSGQGLKGKSKAGGHGGDKGNQKGAGRGHRGHQKGAGRGHRGRGKPGRGRENR